VINKMICPLTQLLARGRSGRASLSARDHAVRQGGSGCADDLPRYSQHPPYFASPKNGEVSAESIECFRGSPAHRAAKRCGRQTAGARASAGLRVTPLGKICAGGNAWPGKNGPTCPPRSNRSRAAVLFCLRTGSQYRPARITSGLAGQHKSQARVNQGRRAGAKALFKYNVRDSKLLAPSPVLRPAISRTSRRRKGEGRNRPQALSPRQERWPANVQKTG